MRTFKLISFALVSGVALASCQSNPTPTPQVAVAPPPKPEPVKVAPKVNRDPLGLNGKWVPTDEAGRKIYYNEFKNGRFLIRSPDGQSTIGVGKYKSNSNGGIDLNWYSEARKANASAVCNKLSDNELQCSSNGSVFNIRRA